MQSQWYVLRSKPNREEALWREATARGLETYYPRVRVRPVNPRARSVKPYFPGYLFVQADMKCLGHSVFAWMPYSNGLVLCGAEPASVPAALVGAIRSRVDAINEAGGEPFSGLKHGELVRIESGPFAGSEALFDHRLSGSQRVRVLLQLVNRQMVPLELAAGSIGRKTRH